MPPAVYDGYVRQSQESEGSISPAEQRDKIEGWIRLHHEDIILGEVFEDIDVPGSSMERPQFLLAKERILDGRSKGIIVAKLDRFGRTSGEASITIKEIEDAGGQLVSVAESFDTTTPAGAFARGIVLLLAEMELAYIRANWRAARVRAIKAGKLPGPTPLGYVRHPTGEVDKHGAPRMGPLEIDEPAAEQVEIAFNLAARFGTQAALDHLREHFPDGPVIRRRGEEPRNGDRVWTIAVAQKLLARRVYVGELRHGDIVERHPDLEIVDPVTWNQAQHERAVNQRQRRVPDFPLAALATCDSCGRPLTAGLTARGERRYRCVDRECPGRAHPLAEPLETFVLDAIRANPPSINPAEVVRRVTDVMLASNAVEAHAVTREVYESVNDLSRWEELDAELREKLAVARLAAMPTQRAPLPDLDGDLTPDQLRVVFKRAVESCSVKPGRAPLAERVTLTLAA